MSELQFGASTQARPVHFADQINFSPDHGSPQSKSGCSPSIPVSKSTAVAPSPSYSKNERSDSVFIAPSVPIITLCHAMLAFTTCTVSCIIDSTSSWSPGRKKYSSGTLSSRCLTKLNLDNFAIDDGEAEINPPWSTESSSNNSAPVDSTAPQCLSDEGCSNWTMTSRFPVLERSSMSSIDIFVSSAGN